MGHEKMIPDEEKNGEENLGIEIEDTLEVTTEKMRDEERKLEEKKGHDAWREQK